MGRLVANPELRHTQNGLSVTSFTLAVDRSYARAGEEKVTDFIDIVAWRSSADFAAKWFSKGQLVAVDGSLQTRTYQDKNGINRKVYEVVADKLHFAERKKDSYTSDDGFSDQNLGDVSQGSSDVDAFSGSSSVGTDVSSKSSEGSFETGKMDFAEIPTDDDDLPF